MYYSPFKRRSSSASKPPISPPPLSIPGRPVYSSAISESPIATTGPVLGSPGTPYTPPSASTRDPLLPLSEDGPPGGYPSTGSRAPLLPGGFADFSPDPEELPDDESSVVLIDDESPAPTPAPMPAKQQTTPLRMPPPGIHDPYVSRFLTPLDAGPSAARPAPLLRSSSMPGVPQTGLGASLLPESPVGPEDEDVEGKLIFEVFDAQFEKGADHMAKILKGHLAEVLKMQEEVGKMHLGLEGLRAPAVEGVEKEVGEDGEETALKKREEGVEDIMERLGALSDELRKYHALGTPKLSFPKQSKPESANHARSQSQSQSMEIKGAAVRRSPTSPKNSPERDRSMPRVQSNLDKLTAGLNIDIPEALKAAYPDYTTLRSPPALRGDQTPPKSSKSPGPGGSNLAQQATKRSLAQAWDKDHADQKDSAESMWVENIRRGLDKGSPNKPK